MKDVNTDRPKCIKVLYVYDNFLTIDTPSGCGTRLDLIDEVVSAYGKNLWLFAAYRNDNNHEFAKEYYVPLFS